MNCQACGAAVPERASFCPNCGTKLDGSNVQPIQSAQPQQPGFQSNAQPTEPQGWQQPVTEGANTAACEGFGVNANPAETAYANPGAGRPTYVQSCLAAAVNDIKDTPDLAKKACLLGVIEWVPVLNFVVSGYALNWSREVPFGGRTRMPQKIVTGQNFEIGFYAFLIGLVVGLVAGLASGILALVPILGAIAAVCVSLFASMFQFLAEMRMGVMQQLGEGFKVTLLWDVLKRNWTGLLAVAIVPSLVAAVAACVLWGIAALIGAGSAIPMAFSESAMSVGVASGVFGLVTVLVCIVAAFGSGICIAAATMVTMRALGHWVARYAPEWVDDAWRAMPYQAPRY